MSTAEYLFLIYLIIDIGRIHGITLFMLSRVHDKKDKLARYELINYCTMRIYIYIFSRMLIPTHYTGDWIIYY